ncbi:FadR/GntR family transcriptional regulator [Streptomyces oceani]|uniref:GntR family transcriptional regulator n=1 Tax=Streptomyces oceani TaxID=1075402 RepID=A0A1E7KEU9_9ACTN|nr:FadR/GntR family transcriptional regulator [Streptomyces oceani]OEV02425.1 GntR family transcriptional regulator [Streptomyces oceani]
MPEIRGGRSPLREEVTEGIKQYILQNRLRPGDSLPTESALCEALGASRSSVREAVKKLHALDIVEVRHGHGTFVGRLSLSALVESLTFRGLLSPKDDFQVLSDLVDARELFERGMVERMTEDFDPEYLTGLDLLVEEMHEQTEKGTNRLVSADRAFHTLLVEPMGNELIGQLSRAFWDVYSIVAPHLNMITAEDEAATLAAHHRIVTALAERDREGYLAAITDHYAPVRRRIAAARRETSES